MNECLRCGRLPGNSHTEICALQGEMERLRHDIERHIKIASELATENERLRAELAECRKDAARYQWLRSINCPWPGVFQHEGNDDYGWSAIAGQDLDAAIDAALREGGE